MHVASAESREAQAPAGMRRRRILGKTRRDLSGGFPKRNRALPGCSPPRHLRAARASSPCRSTRPRSRRPARDPIRAPAGPQSRRRHSGRRSQRTGDVNYFGPPGVGDQHQIGRRGVAEEHRLGAGGTTNVFGRRIGPAAEFQGIGGGTLIRGRLVGGGSGPSAHTTWPLTVMASDQPSTPRHIESTSLRPIL